MLESATAVASLRIRAPVRDRAALQLAIDRQFQAAELTPPELPPSALLLVRHLDDPLPGKMAADRYRVRPPQAWTEAVRDRLALLFAEAQRPRAGRLSAAADAVLFSDEAEAVACLVLDLVRGGAGSRWWWRRIGVALPELMGASADGGASALDPGRVLVSRARDVPAVFGYLAQWRSEIEVTAAIDDGRTRELLQAMVPAHRVDPAVIGPDPQGGQGADNAWEARSLRSAVQSSGSIAPPPLARAVTEGQSLAEAHSNLELAEQSEDCGRCEEPWSPWLPPSLEQHSLSPEQRCLLGLALALQSAPTLVRQPGFTRRARVWWQFQERIGRLPAWDDRDDLLRRNGRDSGRGISGGSSYASTNLTEAGTEVASQGEMASARTSDEIQHAKRHSSVKTPVETTSAQPLDDALPWESGQGTRSGRERYQIDPSAADIVDARDVTPLDAADTEPVTAGSGVPDRAIDPDTPRPGDSAQSQPETTRSDAIRFIGETFNTRLGGVLYLINALEDLDIPMAFENPWSLASRVGPWGALDLIARILLNDRPASFGDDAIWAVLAGLAPEGAGEPLADRAATTVPGDGLPRSQTQRVWSETTPNYQAPAKWRTALDEPGAALHWTSSGGRLWLWSVNGYLIASVRRDGQRPERQARALAAVWQRDEPVVLARDTLAKAPLWKLAGVHRDLDLCAWAGAAGSAVARRLGLALGIAADGQDPFRRLLSIEARLYVTRSHVDLVADIDQIWLPARRAGLDRNPGWLADYGRVVLFHFI